MGMNAGRLNRRVQFQRATEINDGFQTIKGTFVAHGNVTAASRRDVSDAEKMSGGRLLSEVTARFRVRASAFTRQITAADRLLCDGKAFNILGIKEGDERGIFLEITAVAAGVQ